MTEKKPQVRCKKHASCWWHTPPMWCCHGDPHDENHKACAPAPSERTGCSIRKCVRVNEKGEIIV